MMLVDSSHEYIPDSQATSMDLALKSGGIVCHLFLLPGSHHGLDNKGVALGPSIAFLREYILYPVLSHRRSRYEETGCQVETVYLSVRAADRRRVADAARSVRRPSAPLILLVLFSSCSGDTSELHSL